MLILRYICYKHACIRASTNTVREDIVLSHDSTVPYRTVPCRTVLYRTPLGQLPYGTVPYIEILYQICTVLTINKATFRIIYQMLSKFSSLLLQLFIIECRKFFVLYFIILYMLSSCKFIRSMLR